MIPTARKLARRIRNRLSRLGRAKVGRDARLEGRVWIHGGGRVEIRDGARVEGGEVPVELHAEPGGEIVIGPGAVVGGGTSIEATARVLVGENARLGRYCKVLDNSFHETSGDRNQRPPSQPVEIGAGAVVGERAILLPGARVKPGQNVTAGAVVRGPPAAAGHAVPARPDPAVAVRPPERSRIRHALDQASRDPAGVLAVLAAWVRAVLVFRRGERSPGIRVRGRLRVARGGTLLVGPRATFLGGMLPTSLATCAGATLTIGEGCVFNYGVTVDASVAVTLGAFCMLGSMVKLVDRDGERSGPIVIGERVWLAHGVTVMPGVRIGAGSVVSAGSVVVRDVPADSFVAGNPARAISLALAVGPAKQTPRN